MPSPQLTVRVIWPTGPSSVSEVWVMVPVRSTHEIVKVPFGALRSGTSWVIEAAGPERWFFGVTVSRTWVTPVRFTEADHVVTPTLLPPSGARGRVGERDDVRRGVGRRVPGGGTWKLSAGLVSVMARPVTGPGLTGGLARAGPGADDGEQQTREGKGGGREAAQQCGLDMGASVATGGLVRTRTAKPQAVVSTTRGPA